MKLTGERIGLHVGNQHLYQAPACCVCHGYDQQCLKAERLFDDEHKIAIHIKDIAKYQLFTDMATERLFSLHTKQRPENRVALRS